MDNEELATLKAKLELSEEKNVLIREIAILREENLDLKKRVKYNAKYKAIAYKMNRFVDFIKGSNSVRISEQAKNLCNEFEEVRASRLEIFAEAEQN